MPDRRETAHREDGLDVSPRWEVESISVGGAGTKCPCGKVDSRGRRHHRYHHHPPYDGDRQRICRAPRRQHRHHMPAAHVHHFHLDATAEQQIGPCRRRDRGGRLTPRRGDGEEAR